MADRSLGLSLPGGGNQGNASGRHRYGITAAEAPSGASVTAFAATRFIKLLAVLGLITTGLAARVYHSCLQHEPGVRIPDPDHRQSAFHHFIMAFRRLTLESFAVIFLIAATSVRCANAAIGEIRGE